MMRSSILILLLIGAAASSLRAKVPDMSAFDIGCYMESDPEDGTEQGGAKGKSYRGLMTSTESGRTCQNWQKDHPWKDAAKIKATEDKMEEIDSETSVMNWGNGLGNHNYCRNPNMRYDRPWCYTLDTNSRYMTERCEIPKCPAKKKDYVDEAKTLKTEIGSHDCGCSDQLYGSSTTTKDTA